MTSASADRTFLLQDGGSLKYCVAGEGEPLVLLHGFGLDASMWDPQWDALSKRYRTLRYDLRGYGGSSLPAGPYSHLEDFCALTQSLGMYPAHLIGLSMGGRYASRLAAHAPSAVRSLTLVDSALDGHVWSDEWLARWQAIASAARSDVARAKELWLTHEIFSPARRDASITHSLKIMIERYSGWHFLHRDPGDTPSPPTSLVLSRIATPTLVIVGDQDIRDFQLIARRMADEIPQARLQVLQGAGHMANLEKPDEFIERVLVHLAHASAQGSDSIAKAG
jgi:pimeloyl-ACP methyl ester carboxylesterase